MAFEDRIVWQRAMDLAEAVYALTKDFPPEERFGLVSQLRRAAVSIPSNIAEGHGRNSDGQLIQFLCTARGSSFEVHTQLLLAKRLTFGSEKDRAFCIKLCDEVKKMLNASIVSLRAKKPKNLTSTI